MTHGRKKSTLGISVPCNLSFTFLIVWSFDELSFSNLALARTSGRGGVGSPARHRACADSMSLKLSRSSAGAGPFVTRVGAGWWRRWNRSDGGARWIQRSAGSRRMSAAAGQTSLIAHRNPSAFQCRSFQLTKPLRNVDGRSHSIGGRILGGPRVSWRSTLSLLS